MGPGYATRTGLRGRLCSSYISGLQGMFQLIHQIFQIPQFRKILKTHCPAFVPAEARAVQRISGTGDRENLTSQWHLGSQVGEAPSVFSGKEQGSIEESEELWDTTTRRADGLQVKVWHHPGLDGSAMQPRWSPNKPAHKGRKQPIRAAANHSNFCCWVDTTCLPVQNAHDISHCDVG